MRHSGLLIVPQLSHALDPVLSTPSIFIRDALVGVVAADSSGLADSLECAAGRSGGSLEPDATKSADEYDCGGCCTIVEPCGEYC